VLFGSDAAFCSWFLFCLRVFVGSLAHLDKIVIYFNLVLKVKQEMIKNEMVWFEREEVFALLLLF